MRLLSPRELAEALGVSESSLKRWVDAGKIAASRTDGGHRRIALPEAVRFIRETGAPLAHPEILELPAAAATGQAPAGDDPLLGYLERGDAAAAGGWILARYLAGASVAELADGPVRAAMHALGELWRHDARGVFIEHRATEACLQAMAQLRATLGADAPGADAADPPIALGGAPEDDPYRLPTFLAGMVCAEAGLRAINLGPDTPLAALRHAVDEHQPRLVWISASSPIAPARARALARWIAGLPRGTAAVVGGRTGPAIAAHGARYLDTMAELAEVARDAAARRDARGRR